MIYENKFGKIKIELENLNNKTIGIAMSGGADSTLLCCLLANTIKEKGLDITIQPYNGYDMWAPGDSAQLPEIIDYIRAKYTNVIINNPIFTVFNSDGGASGKKQDWIRPLHRQLVKHGVINHTYHAISLGPPIEVQEKWKTNFRIPGGRDYNKNTHVQDDKNTTPFMTIDKRFMIREYEDEGLDDLLEMTASCIVPGEKPCGQCFWCLERNWAYREVLDKSWT